MSVEGIDGLVVALYRGIEIPREDIESGIHMQYESGLHFRFSKRMAAKIIEDYCINCSIECLSGVAATLYGAIRYERDELEVLPMQDKFGWMVRCSPNLAHRIAYGS